MKRIATIAAALFLLAGPAGASHPERVDQTDELLRVTQRLEQAAHRLHTRAERRAHKLDRSGQRALGSIEFLANGTSRFHRKAEQGELRAKTLRRRYRHLVKAFRHAEHCFSELDPGPRLSRDFDRVARLVDRLDHRIEAVVTARSSDRHRKNQLAYRDRDHRRDRDRDYRRDRDRDYRRDRDRNYRRDRDRNYRRDRIVFGGWSWGFARR